MRTTYVLIDFENVQPAALEPLAHEHFRLIVFVGGSQARLPFEIADFLQRLGSRAEYVKISGNGSNALDFHIAYYIGRLACLDPSAYFHIISKDTGFDPLIQHLRSKNLSIGRVKTVSDILQNEASLGLSLEERVEATLTRLRRIKAARPRTVKTLTSTIASLFRKQLSEQDVADIIRALADQAHICITDNKIVYEIADLPAVDPTDAVSSEIETMEIPTDA